MRDPFSWSLPLGRLFGITIRIHILFLLFVFIMWARAATDAKAYPGSGGAMLVLMLLLFFSVLLHEFGHCFAARWVDGDAREVLLWPLGGLASCEVPHTPRANFICAAGGPLVNLLLCVLVGGVLVACQLVPSFDPRPGQVWLPELYNFHDGKTMQGSLLTVAIDPAYRLETWQVLLAMFFWVNWVGLLINVLLIGYPLDGGRMFQALLWPRLGYRQSMLTAIVVGFLVMLLVGVYAIIVNELLVLCLAAFIYYGCKAEWIRLESGGEESLFGYDFSQGYTSLERDQPAAAPRKKRQNFVQRWLQRRAARKLQRAQERHEADEQRMDQLLQKILEHGKDSLTDEEQRFMKRVADKKRNQS
jgi:Zn-dependent protease